MINELPQLFGKNFLIGFVLPAALTALAVAMVLDLYGYTVIFKAFGDYFSGPDQSDKLPVGRLGLAVVVIWVFAVFLVAVNYSLTRALEGYGLFNPAKAWRWYSLWRFRRLTAQKAVNAKRQTDEEKRLFREAYYALCAKFPEEESLVLPTRFGNIVRAAERYPQIIYNIAPIQSWPRLQSVTPPEHLAAISEAKSSLDFWINLWFGLLTVAALALALRFLPHSSVVGPQLGYGLVAAGVALAVVCAKLAQPAAAYHGALVKTTFDLYRGALAAQLGLEFPKTLADEREMWNCFSRAAIYNNPDAAAGLNRFRAKPEPHQPFKPSGSTAKLKSVKPDR